MSVPKFMRFYSYTKSETLNEWAVSFFSLLNSMYRIQADEAINNIVQISAGMSGKEGGSSVVAEYQKQSAGIHGIVEEVRTVLKARGKQ